MPLFITVHIKSRIVQLFFQIILPISVTLVDEEKRQKEKMEQKKGAIDKYLESLPSVLEKKKPIKQLIFKT